MLLPDFLSVICILYFFNIFSTLSLHLQSLALFFAWLLLDPILIYKENESHHALVLIFSTSSVRVQRTGLLTSATLLKSYTRMDVSRRKEICMNEGGGNELNAGCALPIYVPVAPVFTCYDIAIHVKRPLRNTYVYPIAIDL